MKTILPVKYCAEIAQVHEHQEERDPPKGATRNIVRVRKTVEIRHLLLNFVAEFDGIGSFELEVELHLGRVPDPAAALGLERPVVQARLVGKVASDL